MVLGSCECGSGVGLADDSILEDTFVTSALFEGKSRDALPVAYLALKLGSHDGASSNITLGSRLLLAHTLIGGGSCAGDDNIALTLILLFLWCR